MAYAHSPNARGAWHDLVEHLRRVARLTADFAEPLGAREAGYWVGLWHDVGKFDPEWQRYLAECAAGTCAGDRAGPQGGRRPPGVRALPEPPQHCQCAKAPEAGQRAAGVSGGRRVVDHQSAPASNRNPSVLSTPPRATTGATAGS
jgi:hypothetical protein